MQNKYFWLDDKKDILNSVATGYTIIFPVLEMEFRKRLKFIL